MSERAYLLSLCLFFGTVLIIFGMRFFSSMVQAKARLANDDAYRQMADGALATQSANAAALAGIEAALGELRASLAAVEKILRQVE